MVFAAYLLEIQFWCCPGVGHLNPISKPHRGAFAAFPKQSDKYPTNAWGRGGNGIDCAINKEYNFTRKVVYFVWYIISKQSSPKLVWKYRATGNFLKNVCPAYWRLVIPSGRVFFAGKVTLHNANEMHNEIQHSWFAVYLQKDALFFSFSSKYRVKNKHIWIYT